MTMEKKGSAPPFAAFEWQIAWRYLKAKRSEGGISVMSWISFIGISIAVFALVATLSVRTGFRSEFVTTILGANAHVTVYSAVFVDESGQRRQGIANFDELAGDIAGIDGVTRAAPIIRAQVLASANGRNAGAEIYGMRLEDLRTVPLVAEPETYAGDIANYDHGVAVGVQLARDLGIVPGDVIKLVSPDGARTAFGVSPRVNAYPVVYIFGVGRYDIDKVRLYMPFDEAQVFFNREGYADEIEVLIRDPEAIDDYLEGLRNLIGKGRLLWTWKDSSGAFLQSLEMEDNIMFIIMSVLVLVAASNIVSGLVMLVKNKRRDIGILRTIGLGEGSIMRVFFICGASIGTAGTIVGLILGSLFSIYIDPIFNVVNAIMGGGVWDPRIRFLSTLPSELVWTDLAAAAALSLGLSFGITLLPARKAARMEPLEALRYG